MIVNTFPCICWPFVCLFQKNTYSKPLSVLIGLFAFLLLSCMNFLLFFTGIQFISIYLSVCLSINAVLFSYEKEGNHVICNDMNGPWWNYAKWNKLDRERQGLPRWLCGKESACQCKRCRRGGLDPWVRKIPWRKKWQSTLVFLPEKSHRQKSLVGYSPLGCKEWNTIENTHTHRKANTVWSHLYVGIKKSQTHLKKKNKLI